MPVDTRNKRASCVGFMRANVSPIFPNPDSNIANQADRQHMAYSYPGILVSGAVGQVLRRLLMGMGR